MKLFFGGIIQGSFQGRDIHSQDYREKIKIILRNRYPDIDIFDPFENHNNSIDYDDIRARKTFNKHLEQIKSSELMLAYLPQASMGTAIEMWQAYHYQVPILTISPMTTNWVVRLLAERNFETVENFEKFIHREDLMRLLSAGKDRIDKIEEKT